MKQTAMLTLDCMKCIKNILNNEIESLFKEINLILINVEYRFS